MLDKIGISKYSKLYINIINKSLSLNRIKRNKNDKDYIYYEKHHILPSALYPEYKNLNINKWNSVLLTAREHFICHLLLWKHYKFLNSNHQYKMGRAIKAMQKMGEYNSKLYESYKLTLKNSKESKIKNSISHKGKKHGPKSKECRELLSKQQKELKLLSKEFQIFDNNDNIIYEIYGRFDTFCKENNLPFTPLRESYLNNGKKIYQSNHPTLISRITNSGMIKYKGWYAKYK